MTTLAEPIIDWSALAARIGADLRPGVAERDTTGEISTAAFDSLRVQGITRALVPIEFGGGGATHAEAGAMLRELARHDGSTAVTLAMHTHLVAAQVWRHNHGMDASAIFGKVADGAVLVSTGAADWVASSGSAVRVDGGYRVSGRKSPASGCEVGDIVVTSVRWDAAPEGPKVAHCAIPLSAHGVRIDKTWDTLGLRATGSHTVVFEDVFVPDAAVSLIRPADAWPPILNIVMGAAMPLIIATYVGIADAAVEIALATVAGRAEPHICQLVGEMLNAHTTAVDVMTAMFADSGNLGYANTDAYASKTLSRKTVAAQALIETVRLAIEVTGGLGYSRHCELERLYRDIHGCLFHPLPRAKQTQFSGRVALGMSPA